MSSTHLEDATVIFKSRCTYYESALLHHPTPLFRAILCLSWEYHKRALTFPRIRRDVIDALDQVHQTLEEHWSTLHHSFLQYTSFMLELVMYQEILASRLLCDYAGEHSTSDATDRWLQKQAALIKQHSKSATGSGENSQQDGEGDKEGKMVVVGREEEEYQKDIVRPLDELMLDVTHAENHLIAAAEAIGQQEVSPGSRIRQFIDKCDWPALAETIVKDVNLLVELWELHHYDDPFSPQLSLDKDKANRISKGISKIKYTYFATLSKDGTAFTLSKHAMELSLSPGTKQSEDQSLHPGTEKSVTAESESGQRIGSERQSLWARVKGIADLLRGHLGDVAKHGLQVTNAEKGTRQELEPLIEFESEKDV